MLLVTRKTGWVIESDSDIEGPVSNSNNTQHDRSYDVLVHQKPLLYVHRNENVNYFRKTRAVRGGGRIISPDGAQFTKTENVFALN